MSKLVKNNLNIFWILALSCITTLLFITAAEKSDQSNESNYEKVSTNICNLTLVPETKNLCPGEITVFTAELKPCSSKEWSFQILSGDEPVPEKDEDGSVNYTARVLINEARKYVVDVAFEKPGNYFFEVISKTNDSKDNNGIKRKKSAISVHDPKSKLTVDPLKLKLGINESGTVKATIDNTICPDEKVTVEWDSKQLKVEVDGKGITSAHTLDKTANLTVTPIVDGFKILELTFKVGGDVAQVVEITVPLKGCDPVWEQPVFALDIKKAAFCVDEKGQLNPSLLHNGKIITDGSKIPIKDTNCGLTTDITVNNIDVSWTLNDSQNQTGSGFAIDLSGLAVGLYIAKYVIIIDLQNPGNYQEIKVDIPFEIFDDAALIGPDELCFPGEKQFSERTKYTLKLCTASEGSITSNDFKLYLEPVAGHPVEKISVNQKSTEFYIEPVKPGTGKVSFMKDSKPFKDFSIKVHEPEFKSLDISGDTEIDWQDKSFSVDLNDPSLHTAKIKIESIESSETEPEVEWYYTSYTKSAFSGDLTPETINPQQVIADAKSTASGVNFSFDYKRNETKYHYALAKVKCHETYIYLMHRVSIADSVSKVLVFPCHVTDYTQSPPESFNDGQLVKAVALDEDNNLIKTKVDWAGILDKKRLEEPDHLKPLKENELQALNEDINAPEVFFYLDREKDDGNRVTGTLLGSSTESVKQSQALVIDKKRLKIRAEVTNGDNDYVEEEGVVFFKLDNIEIVFDLIEKEKNITSLKWVSDTDFEVEKITFEDNGAKAQWNQNKDKNIGEVTTYHYYTYEGCKYRDDFKYYLAEVEGLLYSYNGNTERKQAIKYPEQLNTAPENPVKDKAINKNSLVLEPKLNPSAAKAENIFKDYTVAWDIDKIEPDGKDWDNYESSNDRIYTELINLEHDFTLDLKVILNVSWGGYSWNSIHHFDVVEQECKPLKTLTVGNISIPIPEGGIPADPEASGEGKCVYKFTADYNLKSVGINGHINGKFHIIKDHNTGNITGGSVSLSGDSQSSDDNVYTIAKYFEFKATALTVDIVGGDETTATVGNASAELSVKTKSVNVKNVAGTSLVNLSLSNLAGTIKLNINNNGFTPDFSGFNQGTGSVKIGQLLINLEVSKGEIAFKASNLVGFTAPAPIKNLKMNNMKASGKLIIKSQATPSVSGFSFSAGLSAELPVNDKSIEIAGKLILNQNYSGSVNISLIKPVELEFAPLNFEFKSAQVGLDFDFKKSSNSITLSSLSASAFIDLFKQDNVLKADLSYKNNVAVLSVSQPGKFNKTIGPLRDLTVSGINGDLTFNRDRELDFKSFSNKKAEGSFDLLASNYKITFEKNVLSVDLKITAEKKVTLIKPINEVTVKGASVNLAFAISSGGLEFKTCTILSKLEGELKFKGKSIALTADVKVENKTGFFEDIKFTGEGKAVLKNSFDVSMKGPVLTVLGEDSEESSSDALIATASFDLSSVKENEFFKVKSISGKAHLAVFDQPKVAELSLSYLNSKLTLGVSSLNGVSDATVLKSIKIHSLQGFAGEVTYDFNSNEFDINKFNIGTGTGKIGVFDLAFSAEKNDPSKISVSVTTEKEIILNKNVKLLPFEDGSLKLSAPTLNAQIQIFDTLKVNSFDLKTNFSGKVNFKGSTLALESLVHIQNFESLKSDVDISLEGKDVLLGIEKLQLRIPAQKNIAKISVNLTSVDDAASVISLKEFNMTSYAKVFKTKDLFKLETTYKKNLFTFALTQKSEFIQPADLNLGPVKNLRFKLADQAKFTYDGTKFDFEGFSGGSGTFKIADQLIGLSVASGKIEATYKPGKDVELGNLGPVKNLTLKDVSASVTLKFASNEEGNSSGSSNASKFGFEKFTFFANTSAEIQLKQEKVVDITGKIDIDSADKATFTQTATLSADKQIKLGQASLTLHGGTPSDSETAEKTPVSLTLEGDLNAPDLSSMFKITSFKGSGKGLLYGAASKPLAEAKVKINNSTFEATFKTSNPKPFTVGIFEISSAEAGGKIKGDFSKSTLTLENAFVQVGANFTKGMTSGNLNARVDYINEKVKGRVLESTLKVQPKKDDPDSALIASIKEGYISIDSAFNLSLIDINNATLKLSADKVNADITVNKLVYSDGALTQLKTTGKASILVRGFSLTLKDIYYTKSNETFSCTAELKVGLKNKDDEQGKTEDNILAAGFKISPSGLIVDDIYLKINYGILSGEGEVKFVEDESKKLSYFKADIDLSLAKTLKRSPVQGLSLGSAIVS